VKIHRDEISAPALGNGGRSATFVAHAVGDLGGQELVTAKLVEGFLQRGYRVTVVTGRSTLAAHPRLRVVRVPIPRRPASIKQALFPLWSFLSVRRHGDGVVYSCGPIGFNITDVTTAHFCVRHYHDHVGVERASRDNWIYRANARIAAWISLRIERTSYRRTRTVVPVSAGLQRELLRYFPWLAGRCRVIPNGVDLSLFRPDPPRRRLVRASIGIDEATPLAAFVGGDWDRKGLRLALEALAQAPDWHLLVLGQGDVERFRRFAAAAGVDSSVHFLGRQRSCEYMPAADCLVLPSSYEAFPLVALEAAACGLPLVASKVNGLEDLVQQGTNGFFIDRSTASIAAALRRLSADRSHLERMSTAARGSVVQLSWDRIVDQYSALHQEALSRAGT
jgi:glycosyltransferase involved in cell wall biosynthesis